MNIQKYLAFVKTAEHGSFTKAAETLGYTQSGISHMINDLETQWSVTLFDRDRSGIRITSDGIKLLPFAQQVCASHSRLATEVEELHGLRSGLIRIGTLSSIATHWLPNIIKHFQKDYPQIQYELLMGDYKELENWIAEGRVDCSFLKLPITLPLETIFLEQDRLLAVLPKNHPMSKHKKFPLKALQESPFMLLQKGNNDDISPIFQEHNLTPDIRFTTWDDYAIMSMVENGMGISILPELILKRIPYKIITKELQKPAYRQLGIALKNSKTAPLAVKRFLDYLHYRNPTQK